MTATKTDKLIRVLKQNRGDVSVNVIRARTGLKNVSSTVHRLRVEGFDIMLNRKPNSKGQIQNYYRLG